MKVFVVDRNIARRRITLIVVSVTTVLALVFSVSVFYIQASRSRIRWRHPGSRQQGFLQYEK
jgi:hypothetical protein